MQSDFLFLSERVCMVKERCGCFWKGVQSKPKQPPPCISPTTAPIRTLRPDSHNRFAPFKHPCDQKWVWGNLVWGWTPLQCLSTNFGVVVFSRAELDGSNCILNLKCSDLTFYFKRRSWSWIVFPPLGSVLVCWRTHPNGHTLMLEDTLLEDTLLEGSD